jgi:hypothetical protein
VTELSPQAIAALRQALVLRSFSVPQLALESGLSYDAVRRTLEREDGSTVRRTSETTFAGIVPATEVWEVSDPAALAARLEAAGAAAQPDEPPAEAGEEAEATVEGGVFVASAHPQPPRTACSWRSRRG